MRTCIGKIRFDNLAELREAINRAFDGQVIKRAEEVLSQEGPMTLDLIKETLSDQSKVYNFRLSGMTPAQIKRERE